MPNTTMSPNMNLVIPTVSVDPGPDWANNINASLSIIDQHNHSSGSGVQISQNGINLQPSTNSDSLNFNSSNAYGLRSARFVSQASPLSLAADKGCLYESGVDLYFNDGSGNQIRITQGGSVSGSAGTITGLPSGTASASYSSGTFTFQSATNTPANISGASLVLAQQIASPNTITLSSPNSLSSSYSLVAPTALPGSQSFVTLDSSGNLAAPTAYPLTSSGIATNTVQGTNLNSNVCDGSTIVFTSNKLRLAPANTASSTQINFSTNSTSLVGVVNSGATITTRGRPVVMVLLPFDNSSTSFVGLSNNVTASFSCSIFFYRGLTQLASSGFEPFVTTTSVLSYIPPGALTFIDVNAGAATYVYSLSALVNSVNTTLQFNNCSLFVYEL